MSDLQKKASRMIDEAADQAQQMADKTLRNASHALDEASERLAASRTKAGEAVDVLAERAQHYARAGVDKAYEARDRAKRGLQHAGDVTTSYVEDQPLKSIAIAAGVGAATAALLMLLRGRDH